VSRLSVPLLILIIIGSCSNAPPAGKLMPVGDDALAEIFPPQATESAEQIEIISRLRLELPRYRIKGTCAIYRSPDGSLEIDFVHSSLFGSYREDATIRVAGDSVTIQDHERGTFMGSRETLEHLSRHFEFDVIPEDLAVFLLLGAPRPEDLANTRVSVSGGNRTLAGEWMGRQFEIESGDGRGPIRMKICAADGSGCYEARYRYDSKERFGGYPERMICEKMGGSERFSMTVEVVRRSGDSRDPDMGMQ
jgi:hypothetical protein